MGRQPLLEQRRHLQRQAQHHVRCALCPAAWASVSRLSSSLSLIIGIIGEHSTPTGMPCLAHHADRPQSRLGRHRTRLRDTLELVVRLVRLIIPATRRCLANSVNRSRSRGISEPLVMIVTEFAVAQQREVCG